MREAHGLQLVIGKVKSVIVFTRDTVASRRQRVPFVEFQIARDTEPLWSYSRPAAKRISSREPARARPQRVLDRAPFRNDSYHGCNRDGFLSPPCSPGGSHTWAAWRHETKRGSEARTFDIAFLRGPGPPQRGAGSINRISGRSLIIHLCTPVRRMANPRKSRIFSLAKAPRENPISAPWRVSSSSYPWNAVSCWRKDNGPIARTIANAIPPYIVARRL